MPAPALSNCRLYGFLDTAYIAGRDPGWLTQQLIEGGVDLIQVRAKNSTSAQRLQLSRTVVTVAGKAGVPVIVNDDLDAALASGADGVHLGQEDWAAIPPTERAQRLTMFRLVGISTHSLEQALQAEGEGANYIGVGPIFPTGTKPKVQPVGLGLIKQVAGRIKIPFFAIGGITLNNLAEVRTAGATRVAVVSGILQVADVAQAARNFKEKLA